MSYEKILEVLTRRGFLWPSAEIYGGVAGFYDYGPLGKLLKDHIENLFREYYVFGEGFPEIETSNICPQDVFVASGHVEGFADLMAECTKCGEPYRIDHLIKEQTGNETDGLDKEELGKLVEGHKIRCPKCKSALGGMWEFNLMFKTDIGPGKNRTIGYMRPETAQGIFTNFRRLFEYNRRKLPLGVLQIGRSYRNEISPRQGMLRLREFNQAEVEIFLTPDQKAKHPRFSKLANDKLTLYPRSEQSKKSPKPLELTLREAVDKKIIKHQYLGYYLALSLRIFKQLGIPLSDMRCRQHTPSEMAHYSDDTWDIEIDTHFGWLEVVGIADRTDYDLSSHQEVSKQSMEVPYESKKLIPHVIEPSYGINRLAYCILEKAYREDKRGWAIFNFAPSIAPYQVAVYALVNKEGMDTKAEQIYHNLRDEKFYVALDNSGSIGRRYARADEVGTLYCVTVDGDTLKNSTITLRDRDSRKQVRIHESEIANTIKQLQSGKLKFSKAGKPV